jgi:hypothetical protein
MGFTSMALSGVQRWIRDRHGQLMQEAGAETRESGPMPVGVV